MSDERNNQENLNENEGGMEYTRTHTNREFHNNADQDKVTSEDRNDDSENTENYNQDETEGDLYANTITGYRDSASARTESFTDENYGATGQKTLKDIIRATEDKEEDKKNDNENS